MDILRVYVCTCVRVCVCVCVKAAPHSHNASKFTLVMQTRHFMSIVLKQCKKEQHL